MPGEYVKASLVVGEYADAVVVPERAVIKAQEGSRVLIVNDQNQVETTVVGVADNDQGLKILDSGLKPGQQVIVEGIQLVRPGQTVAIEVVSIDKYIRDENQSPRSSRFDSPIVRLPEFHREAPPVPMESRRTPPELKAGPSTSKGASDTNDGEPEKVEPTPDSNVPGSTSEKPNGTAKPPAG